MHGSTLLQIICNYNLKSSVNLGYRGAMRELLPLRSDYTGIRANWRHDLLAGIAVGIVALPLALGFGIATGTGATSGIITAIVAGFLAAIFGGSRFQVSGPTGAMTVVLVPIVERHGVSIIAFVGLIAGALSVMAGVFKLGKIFARIPWSVLEGFTAGIGLVIALQQIPLALDIEKPAGSNAFKVGWKSIAEVSATGVHTHALLITFLAITTMVLAPRIFPRIPASIVTVIFCTFISAAFQLSLSEIGALPRSLPIPSLPHFPSEGWGVILSSSLAVFALGAIESVLSGKVAEGLAHARQNDTGTRDQASDQPAAFNSNRELFGQGLATMASATMGGIPATGAIARTAVNVRSGARSRVASMIHALFLLSCIVVFAPLVSRIPISALAGVLIVTALRMVQPKVVLEALVTTKINAITMVITAISTVALDLIWAVVIGIVVHFALSKLPWFAR
jgi:SulP family sulfate permease